jgi:acyl-coenzyme A thioesterase PaaI-like protein
LLSFCVIRIAAVVLFQEKLEVECKVLRAGKNLAVIEVNVRKENGVLVAQGRHTKYLSVAGSKL